METDEYETVRNLICQAHDIGDDCESCPLYDVNSCYEHTAKSEKVLLALFDRRPEKYGEAGKEECRSNALAAPVSANQYPQDIEEDEYRYIDAGWLEAVARGLTAGAKKHPGETWRQIPPEEHAARAMRHLNLYRAGDHRDTHLINAAMRCMMAYATELARGEGQA